MKDRKKNPAAFFIIFILTVTALFSIYTTRYYRADEDARKILNSKTNAVTITKTDYGWLFDGPSEDSALIFYPGARVEETAYAPLLHRIASGVMDVCLVKMPFHLAVFDKNAADKVMPQYNYQKWYIGGHSLGGAMAALYAAESANPLEGIILLASYPTKPLPENLKEILLVGSEDGVIRWEKVDESRQYSPRDCTEHIIQGGNHAQFGSYGKQKGDGNAQISDEMQVDETVEVIRDCVAK